MDHEGIRQLFEQTIRDNPQKSEAISAIQTLIEYIKLNPAETVQELSRNLQDAITVVKSTDHALVASISSGCELFLRFITLTALDSPDFQECKAKMIERGEVFLQKVASSRQKIASLAHPFISDGATILTHSRSRVVLQLLKEASLAKKRFTVYVTDSKPDGAGEKMYNDLTQLGIPTYVILDSAVGYVMEKVDLVLVGAEGVVESGGIINKIGTFTMSICAKEMNKPFYVVAESFKFTRQFPLNQQDVPNNFKYQASKLTANADLSREHPMVDYTPPSYITLLFTDLGILTPSAVSDELIKLYL